MGINNTVSHRGVWGLIFWGGSDASDKCLRLSLWTISTEYSRANIYMGLIPGQALFWYAIHSNSLGQLRTTPGGKCYHPYLTWEHWGNLPKSTQQKKQHFKMWTWAIWTQRPSFNYYMPFKYLKLTLFYLLIIHIDWSN